MRGSLSVSLCLSRSCLNLASPPETWCDELRCPAEGIMNFFAFAILLWEVALVLLAARSVLQGNRPVARRVEICVTLACWLLSAVVGLAVGLYCGIPSANTRELRSIKANRYGSLAGTISGIHL